MITADFTNARWRKSTRSSEATACVEVAFAPATWRKSTRSSDTGSCVEVAFAPVTWRKSTRSSDTTNCVEVAHTDQVVGVRDSKHPAGPVLIFPTTPWTTFLSAR